MGESGIIEKQFRYERRVHFDDTDMGGVAHFARLLAFAEEAEHAALQAVGVPAVPPEACWPRVRVEADFRAPARFGEVVSVFLRCVRIGRTSLTWNFRLTSQSQGLLAEGLTVSCHAMPGQAGTFKPSPMPEAWCTALSRYLS